MPDILSIYLFIESFLIFVNKVKRQAESISINIEL